MTDKLSPAQLRVLNDIKNGRQLYVIDGKTHAALLRRGFINEHTYKYGEPLYDITEKGYKAMEANQ